MPTQIGNFHAESQHNAQSSKTFPDAYRDTLRPAAAAFGDSVVAFVDGWVIDAPGARRAVVPGTDRQAAPLPTETTLSWRRSVSDTKIMIP